MHKIFFIIFIVVLFAASGCKLVRKLQSTKSDSTVVKREVEAGEKIDTSSSKTESAFQSSIVYVPRDTFINNIYYPRQPVVYVNESGSKKEEFNFAIIERYIQNKLDSAAKSKEEVKKDSTTKVLDFWQILALGLVGLIVLYFISTKINFSLKK